MRLDLTKRALQDLRDARKWFEAQRKGLGDRVYDDVASTIDRVLANPHACAEWQPGVRSARCREFPYRVVYRIKADTVRVLAVYHLRRNPADWDRPNR